MTKPEQNNPMGTEITRGVMTHDELVLRAEKWLRQQGCGVAIRDPLRSATSWGEMPDAIGWRDGISILIECKASRADFMADKNKPFRADPAKGMGDWRFYLCPPEIIKVEDLPDGWGLLWALPKTIKKIHGVPGNCGWWQGKPFDPCKRSETMMLVSALRRMVIRGHFHEIYEGIPK